MKSFRHLSLILSFVFVFTSLFSCIPVDDVYASTIALYNEDYENAKEVLNAICPDLPVADGENIKRSDFVAAVTMMLGCGEETNVETGFLDVTPEHKYSGNIKFARGFGLISAVDLFLPDMPITYAQAIKILMSATGHAKKAEHLGGYPSGYMRCAIDADVGTYLNLSNDAPLTYDEAMSLILDAVCTDMLDATAWGDNMEYSEVTGKNILSVYHKIYIAEGRVDANKSTGLYSLSAKLDDYGILVNGNKYYGKGYENLLGKRVRVFFKDANKREILFAYPVYNTSYSFTHEDDLNISSLTLNTYDDKENKEKKYNLDGSYTVIYNGTYYAASESSYNAAINPDAGTVELIDNNSDGRIDVIIAKSIEYGVIGNVNIFEEKIYDKFKANAMKNLSDDVAYSVYVYSDGTKLELSDLKENDVVGYIESSDKKSLEIMLFTGKTGGTYGALSGNVISLGKDKDMELSKYFKDNIKKVEEIKMGTQIIAYLGMGNQIVYIEEYADSVKYGYLVDVGEEAGGLNSGAVAKIYAQDGEMYELKLADKVINSTGAAVSESAAKSSLQNILSKNHTLRVIKFGVNADGELNKVYEATQNTKGISTIFDSSVLEASPVLFDDNTGHGSSSHNGRLYFDFGIFFPYFTIQKNAAILQIPSSAEHKNDADWYGLYTSSSLASRIGSNETVYCYGYDVTKDGAGFVLWVLGDEIAASVSESTLSGVVESITQGVDEDGNPIKIIRMYRDGNWIKLNTPATFTSGQSKTKTALDSVKPGDIARVSYDTQNTITAFHIDFTVADRKFHSNTGDSHASVSAGWGGGYAAFATGYIYSISDGKATIIQNKSINEIDAESQAGTLGLDNVYPVNLSSSKTIFVELKKDRNDPSKILSAEVYKEADMSSVESYFTAGQEADYVVSRARFHAIELNVVYVNINK